MTLINFAPVVYTTHSRLKTFKELVSWVYLFPLFGAYLYLLFSGVKSLLIYPLMFLIVISLYEIGYIFNDISSVKSEKKPTLRHEGDWYKLNFKNFIVARLFLVALLLVVLAVLVNGAELLRFLCFLCVMSLAFCAHNTVRGRFNVVTFLVLSFFKYAAVLSFIHDPIVFLFVFFSFPVLRAIEYASIKDYSRLIFDVTRQDIHKFRVIYYLVIVLLSLWACWFFVLNYLYVLIPFYFFVYRFALLALGFIALNKG